MQNSDFTLWVQSMVIRMEALESIVFRRLGVAEEEIQSALRTVAQQYPLPDNPDAHELLNRFVRRTMSREDDTSLT
jgi:hypothetical protein